MVLRQKKSYEMVNNYIINEKKKHLLMKVLQMHSHFDSIYHGFYRVVYLNCCVCTCIFSECRGMEVLCSALDADTSVTIDRQGANWLAGLPIREIGTKFCFGLNARRVADILPMGAVLRTA